MNKKVKILAWTVPALLCVALAAAVVWGAAQKARADEMSALSEEYVALYVNSCARCAQELADSVDAMSVSLEKLKATGSTAGRVFALEDIVRESAEAEKLISRIPQSQVESMELAAFLTRIGDWARSLSRRLLMGEAIGEKDTAQLDSLIASVSLVAERFSSMAAEGGFPSGTEEYDYYDVSDKNEEGGEPSEPEYPTLLYDGPFSEAVERAEPLGVTGEEGSEDEAKRKAEEIVGAPVSFDGRTEGTIPTYDFSAEGADISITVRGLNVLYFMKTPSTDISGIPDEAEYEGFVAAGEAFLRKLGYDSMAPSYAEFTDGTALISYVWKRGEVFVYNDLVKVRIDRATGEPVGLDARNYLFSHRERTFPEPTLSEDEARSAVSENLVIESSGLALIPVTPMTEALCYEFRGRCGSREFVVYVNAVTGREERVFMVIEDENGKSAV
ncbi:MAG: germination protein YpeB [Clostridia bacterium]|nr:germination protein YpeB [Clostridia bacterium]